MKLLLFGVRRGQHIEWPHKGPMLLSYWDISKPILRLSMKKGAERIERRVKLHDLRVLMSVVERGSMAKAAESLATSQPAISRAIADLEYSLGVCLLDRGPRGIVPTPYGHALIKRGIAIFDELKQGVQDIEFLADPTA